jgi:hypothetical protein
MRFVCVASANLKEASFSKILEDNDVGVMEPVGSAE